MTLGRIWRGVLLLIPSSMVYFCSAYQGWVWAGCLSTGSATYALVCSIKWCWETIVPPLGLWPKGYLRDWCCLPCCSSSTWNRWMKLSTDLGWIIVDNMQLYHSILLDPMGLPLRTVWKWQLVQMFHCLYVNGCITKFHHVTTFLKELHRLPLVFRALLKVLVIKPYMVWSQSIWKTALLYKYLPDLFDHQWRTFSMWQHYQRRSWWKLERGPSSLLHPFYDQCFIFLPF